MSKGNWKFSFRDRVVKPGSAVQAIVTARGEDMDYGRYYVVEGLCGRGRPASASYWEADLLAANPPVAPQKKTVSKSKGKKRRR